MSLGTPVGPLAVTRPVKILMGLSLLGILAIIWRFAAGLGQTTALNDGYPWGLWIAFDVVTGTAIACGGYVIALLVYALNKGQYHSLIRPALLTSALGYTVAGLSVALDVGRPYEMWKIPLFFWSWNLNSALLEVALCIMAYVLVVWIELATAPLDQWRKQPSSRFHGFAKKAYPRLDRALTWIIALALLLPTMHQSSLGTLMVLSGPRLHELWQTPLLPLLFLISCISMGFAAVVMESVLSHYFLGRKIETEMLGRLAKYVVPINIAYVAIRLGDIAVRGAFGSALEPTGLAAMFWLELAFFAAPVVLLAGQSALRDTTQLFRAAVLMIIAGALYRFDTFLVAFQPGSQYRYFPSIGELTVTVGLVSMEILAYVVIIHYYPIVAGVHKSEVSRKVAVAEKAGV